MGDDKSEINITAEVLSLISRRKAFILSFILVCVVLTGLFSLISTKYYTSEVKLLPLPEKLSPFSAALSSIPIELSGLAGGDSSVSIIKNILKSKTISANVVKKLDLDRIFHERGILKRTFSDPAVALNVASEKLKKFVTADSDRSGLIYVSVEFPFPQLSKAIAEEYVEQLTAFLNSSSINASFVVLDKADLPIRPSKPKMVLNLLAAFILSSGAALILGFLMDQYS